MTRSVNKKRSHLPVQRGSAGSNLNSFQDTLFKVANTASGVGFWFFERESRRILLSKSLSDLIGIDRHSSTSIPWSEVLDIKTFSLSNTGLWRSIRRALHRRDGFTHTLRTFPKGYEGARWLKITGEPSYHENGRLLALQGSAVDVSEQVVSKEKLTQVHHQIEEAQRSDSLHHVTALLAHEISNMLQPALSFGDLCAVALENEDTLSAQSYLNDTLDSVARANMLVREALPGVAHDVDLEPMTVHEIITNLQHVIAPSMFSNLIVDCHRSALNQSVNVSQVGIVQVFLNLIRNAFESSGSNSKVFVLMNTLEASGKRQKRLAINILDSGPGFSNEALVHAFDPLFSTKGKKAGNGLGLSVVKSLIESWDGKIEITNIEAGGARVEIELPISKP